MRRFKTVLLVGFAVLLVSVFFNSSVVFGWEQPPGPPPHGVAIKGNAEGIRLSGVLVVEFLNYNFDTFIAEKASVVVRLRKGGQLEAIFSTVPGPLSTSDPKAVQDAIMPIIAPKILETFLDQSYTLTLKFMGEFTRVEGEWGYVTVTPKKGPSYSYPSGTLYVLTDVEFAAK
jgi:hypothetical protein